MAPLTSDDSALLDTLLEAYIEAALFSTNDESDDSGGRPLDDNYGPDNIDPDTLAKMRRDCAAFLVAAWPALCAHHAAAHVDDSHGEGALSGLSLTISQAGHDFWMTRQGHGCGFWDGDWQEPHARRLTEASKRFGEVWLHVENGIIDGH